LARNVFKAAGMKTEINRGGSRRGNKEKISMSNTGMQSRRTALWAVATIAFAVALHSSRANAQGEGAPTDPQIVGIVVAANQIDINYAKLAMSKAKDKQVKEFAQQMITDHVGRAESCVRPRSETQRDSGRQRDQQLA
jgi:uncharacterized protein (DUF305 family)